MRWWFGSKSAPETMACAFAPPPWLAGSCEEGFAPLDGLTALVKASGQFAVFRDGGWELGQIKGASLSVGGNQVVGARLAAVAEAAGGVTVDTEARAAIAAILERLRQHGLIAS